MPELRLRNITDMPSANQYLQEVFIPDYWQKNIAVKAQNIKSEFKPVPAHISLENACVQKEYRKIRRDHTLSYDNQFYLIDSPLRYSIANQKIEIRKQYDGRFTAYFADRKLRVSEIIEPTKPSLYRVLGE